MQAHFRNVDAINLDGARVQFQDAEERRHEGRLAAPCTMEV